MYSVYESEQLFTAGLFHASMVASLYGNSSADIDKGNDQVHSMYVRAFQSIPYLANIGRGSGISGEDTKALVEEWERLNSEEADKEGGA